MLIFMSFLILTLLGLLAYVRLAPSDPAVWNVDPSDRFDVAGSAPWGQVVALQGGAILRIEAETPMDVLSQLDAIALQSPRTRRLAGSANEGRITWVTRSNLWGFPDYTTAAAGPDAVYVFARLRFGKSDLGVNAARLRDWAGRLGTPPPS
jgi:hypothetical protein